MAETDPRVTVLDAGPVIHLDQLRCLDLLEGFGPLYLPATVEDEVRRHCRAADFLSIPDLRRVSDPDLVPASLMTLVRSLDLHAGESAAIALLARLNGQLFLCDDAAARLAAESLGYEVHGTIGLLIRAVRRGKRSAGRNLTLPPIS
jgi:predicted nucleic acid-binding protein